MSSTPPAPAADYRLGASGQIELSEEGEAVVRAFREAEAAFDALEPSWAGAYVASLFVRHPWQQSLRITLWASSEYDDQGSSYRSIHHSASTVGSIPGAALPEGLTVDGQFDETAAIGLIEADLDENDFSLYGAISNGADDWTEHALEVSRDAISDLLACMPISGSLVYRAVCPTQNGHAATP